MGLSDFPFIFQLPWTRVVWTVQIPPKQPVEWGGGGGGAHKAVKSTLVIKQNTAASEEEKIALWLAREKPVKLIPPPPHPPPCLGAHFYAWLNTYLSSWRVCFSQTVAAMIWNFWKVAVNFCDSVNPLWRVWVSSRFSRCKRNVVESSAPLYQVTVLLLWPVTLHQWPQLKQTENCWHRNRCPRWASTPAIFCDVIMSATSAWSSLLCTCAIWSTPKNKRNKTRLTVAPNRGSPPRGAPNLFRLRCGTGI